MKIITICGSLRFMPEMMRCAEKLELDGNCVLTPIYPTREDKDAYTEEELQIMGAAHKKKINLSDAIFVVNKNGYIGNSTKSEIEYATAAGKEVLFMETP